VKYRLHWKDGKTEDGEGANEAEALSKLGYSSGAVAALDFWEPIEETPVFGNFEEVKAAYDKAVTRYEEALGVYMAERDRYERMELIWLEWKNRK
jgi:hypothetical protein